MECLAKTTIDYLIDTDKPQPTIIPLQRSLSNVDTASGSICGPTKSIEPDSSLQNPNSVESGIGIATGTSVTTESVFSNTNNQQISGSVSTTYAPLISPTNNSEAHILPPVTTDIINPMDIDEIQPSKTPITSEDQQAFGKIEKYF